MIDIAVMIAVRDGSKRVPSKNIRPFVGTTLLDNKIEQAKRTGLPVYVSSDSPRMLDIATKKHGVNAMPREAKFASDTIPMGDVYVYMAQQFPHKHVLYMPVTSPMVTDETVSNCLKIYFDELEKQSGIDSVVTTTAVREYLWEGNKAINYDPTNHPRSQDLPPIFALNFAVNILSIETMIRKKNILGDNFIPYEISKIEAIDIDDEDDFQMAKAVFRERQE